MTRTLLNLICHFLIWMMTVAFLEESVVLKDYGKAKQNLMFEMQGENDELCLEEWCDNDLQHERSLEEFFNTDLYHKRGLDEDAEYQAMLLHHGNEKGKGAHAYYKAASLTNQCFTSFFKMVYSSMRAGLHKLGTFTTKPVDEHSLKLYDGPTKHHLNLSKKISPYLGMFNDALWPKQWYVHDYRTKKLPVMDLNVVPVYKAGYTGLGVTVAVVDDGITHNHPDLKDNHDIELSYDFCRRKKGSEPDPPDQGHVFDHGTKVAGVIGMMSANLLCGVGIAYNVKLVGVKTICAYPTDDQVRSDIILAAALNHKLDEIDIYISAWRLDLVESHMYVPVFPLVDAALLRGIEEGRQKKGAIYTFAGGNYREYSNCAVNALVNHPAVLTFASASQRGKPAYYSERCTAIFGTAYAGGSVKDESVISTNVGGSCTNDFTGGDSSVAMATGILALVLESKPELTFRDVMHLIAYTSEVAPLANNKNSWVSNGYDFWVSSDFGFGLLNAENMIDLAADWIKVPELHRCLIDVLKSTNGKRRWFNANDGVPFDFYVDKSCGIKYLENIEIEISATYLYRGAIAVDIDSPGKSKKTRILDARLQDGQRDMTQWRIKSVHHWGESSLGRWRIEVKSEFQAPKRHTCWVPPCAKPATTSTMPGLTVDTKGQVTQLILKLYGTKEQPEHYKKKRVYAAFRLAV